MGLHPHVHNSYSRNCGEGCALNKLGVRISSLLITNYLSLLTVLRPEGRVTQESDRSSKLEPEQAPRLIRPAALSVLLSTVMLSKVPVSVAVGLALFTATVRLPAAPCMVTNTPSQKACQPGCCANKACCETSHERTGPPVQPLTKSGADQQNISAIPTTVEVTLVTPVAATASHVFSSAECIAHSPPPLALICIRLI
jgi:hypothetical protein